MTNSGFSGRDGAALIQLAAQILDAAVDQGGGLLFVQARGDDLPAAATAASAAMARISVMAAASAWAILSWRLARRSISAFSCASAFLGEAFGFGLGLGHDRLRLPPALAGAFCCSARAGLRLPRASAWPASVRLDRAARASSILPTMAGTPAHRISPITISEAEAYPEIRSLAGVPCSDYPCAARTAAAASSAEMRSPVRRATIAMAASCAASAMCDLASAADLGDARLGFGHGLLRLRVGFGFGLLHGGGGLLAILAVDRLRARSRASTSGVS